MLKKIINHIKNPYLSCSDSIIILTIMLLSGGLVAVVAGMSMFFTVTILTVGSVILTNIHHYLFNKKKKNYIRGFIFSATPAEILIIITMLKYSLSIVKMCFAIGITLVLTYLIVFYTISENCKIKKTKCIRGVHSILVLCLIPCIVSFGTHWIGDEAILKKSSVSIDANISSPAVPITSDKWNCMNFNEKFDYLNQIVEVEARDLGMLDTPEVQAMLYPKPLLGTYEYRTDIIVINAEYLRTADADKVISTLGHELYHRFEYFIAYGKSNNVVGVSEERITEYRNDLTNPQNSILNWNGYYNMSIEIDARAMGEQITCKYII